MGTYNKEYGSWGLDGVRRDYNPTTSAYTMPTMPDDPGIGAQLAGAGAEATGAGASGAAVGGPVGAAAGIGVSLAKSGLSIYDKYKQREAAKQQYKEAMKVYKEQKQQEAMDMAREEDRLQRQEAMKVGTYSQNLQDRFAGQSSYGTYNQPRG